MLIKIIKGVARRLLIFGIKLKPTNLKNFFIIVFNKRKIPLFWVPYGNKSNNFGDVLNPWLYKE